MTNLRTLLIIDDNDEFREELVHQLSHYDEFTTLQAHNGQTGLDIAEANRIDLVVLDVEMPDINGREVCKKLRGRGFSAPILMLTAQESEAETILGLDAGANDYVTKPFRIGELLARIRAHLRSFENSEDATFQLGPYEFHPAQKTLIEGENRPIRLTEKETNILKFLYKADGGTVKRDVLLEEVWGYNANVTTHTLETHIYRLRQKIEPDPSNARLLVTDAGGYRLSK